MFYEYIVKAYLVHGTVYTVSLLVRMSAIKNDRPSGAKKALVRYKNA